jgi:RNA polymerase sigma factor (sigma-70 family)
LADPAGADDCLQAVFLILAHKAAALRRPAALAGWLHGVALRVASEARKASNRRRLCPLPANTCKFPARYPDPLEQLTAREFLVAVDEEVQRLPERYRLPVILCCLENHSQEETARRLGWTRGSVKARLERGRKRLEARLAKRGLILPAALAVVAVSQNAAMAAASPGLRAATCKAATKFASGLAGKGTGGPSAPSALAEAVLQSMAAGKLKVLAFMVVILKSASSLPWGQRFLLLSKWTWPQP